jgi:hypothetical protein
MVDGAACFDQAEQVYAWTDHFKSLGTPHNHEQYDDKYLEAVLHQLNLISTLVERHPQHKAFTEKEIGEAIDKLNQGKAPDEWGLAAEHLKITKSTLVPYLVKLFNAIHHLRYVPTSLKGGIITPVPKKDKSRLLTDNYRGITITAVLGKVLEQVLLSRMPEDQSALQFGFTRGASPSMAALLLIEAMAESRDQSQPLFVCTLDAVKAFDTVCHATLMCKLFHHDTDLETLGVIMSLYNGSTGRVKWKGDLGKPFEVLQGVRQGGVLSPRLYKEYIDGLLRRLEAEGDGLHIGATYIGSPTVADDVLLLSQSPLDLQVMLHTSEHYSRRERYQIHPTKSEIIQVSSNQQLTSFQWHIAGIEAELSESATHLGIQHQGAPSRGHCQGDWVKEKLKGTRRTIYGLMGTGLHGTNGLDPRTTIRIYQAYALPKLLYGLDIIILNKTQLKKLEDFHRATLRSLQSLPDRTATQAVYLLSGILPLQALIHMKKLSLIGAIARLGNRVLCDIATRQCGMKDISSGSWFKDIELLLLAYDLPTTNMLMLDPVPKLTWKKLVKSAVHLHWSKKLKREVEEDKSSLDMLNLRYAELGMVHHCWRFLIPCLKDVRRATVRAKLLTGTYPTQERLACYSQGTVSSLCLLCRTAPEDVAHMLIHCPATHRYRSKEMRELAQLVSDNTSAATWRKIMGDTDLAVYLLVDSTFLMDAGLLPADEALLKVIEWHVRRLCYSIHCGRSHLLEALKKKRG